ncbi:hypothetical protein C8J55DRAFT_489730 [Lentinula edodes]|uniref:Uncharacterized protein n=1 Tax=Lentinula lateritia TaxID=40482 RepID=A0A9W9DNQ0_9AGAR|nr:hypothetical protein C8J55DRAFT_489730 [Lentinula edodes]
MLIHCKDISIYQSVVSRSFIRAAHFDNWHCDSVVATANFGLDNFGYTLPLEFIVLDDLAGYNAIFGVEFQQRCQYSNFVRIFDNLPSVRSSLETRLPLPVLPLVTGQYLFEIELLAGSSSPTSYFTCHYWSISFCIPVLTRIRTTVSDTKLYPANRSMVLNNHNVLCMWVVQLFPTIT